jgi:hypothetical protein
MSLKFVGFLLGVVGKMSSFCVVVDIVAAS